MTHSSSTQQPRSPATNRRGRFGLRSLRMVTAYGLRPADLWIDDGKIVSVDRYNSTKSDSPQATLIEDLGDRVVMPGLIDTHVHINEPGRTEWEGFATATRAAAAGGITLLTDMPLNSEPTTTDAPAYDAKRRSAAGLCTVDVAFHGGVIPSSLQSGEPLTELSVRGVAAFKCFLCDSGLPRFPPLSKDDLHSAMETLAPLNRRLLVHAEVVSELPTSDHASSPRSYAAYLASRPELFEEQAIAWVIDACRKTGCPAHIVHLATATGLPLLERARAEGLPITSETCPHYLAFSAEQVEDGDTRFKCAPPIRTAVHREALWQGLEQGIIDFIATDHSPCPPAMKARETGDFSAAWGGISSLQLMLPAVWTAAQEHDRADLETVTKWLSTRPAQWLGLGADRGAIAPGKRADLVVWSPEESFIVSGKKLEHHHPATPYEGQTLKGVVKRTYLEGELAFEDSSPKQPPHGVVVPITSAQSPSLQAFNRATTAMAREQAQQCCGSSRWATLVADRRPFSCLVHLLRVARESFDHLQDDDWSEALSAHPRIGDLRSLEKRFESTAELASNEQSATRIASRDTLRALAKANAEYEDRFGRTFIVFASGKGAEEMLSLLVKRLGNTADDEWSIAIGEQRKITELRLTTTFA